MAVRLQEVQIARFLLVLLVSLAILSSNGCHKSKFCKVSGRVTYADGTPLEIGQICFTDGYYLGRSDIGKNGEYHIHVFRKNDGIPRGTYQVYITAALQIDADETSLKLDVPGLAKLTMLVDPQYTMAESSGWVVDVQKNSKFDFVVYRPGKVPEDQITEGAKFQFDKEYQAKKIREYWDQKAEEERENRERGADSARSRPPQRPKLPGADLL